MLQKSFIELQVHNMDHGLEGLRLHKEKYYCQVCRKQCRDVNAFRCHSATPTHIMNLKHFAQDPQTAIQNFSDQFIQDFLEYIKVRFRNQEVSLKTVYKRYIANPRRIHVTNTRFKTFDRLLEYLRIQHPQLGIQAGTPNLNYRGQLNFPASVTKFAKTQKVIIPQVRDASQDLADHFSKGDVIVRLALGQTNNKDQVQVTEEAGIRVELQDCVTDPGPSRKKKNLLGLLNISKPKC